MDRSLELFVWGIQDGSGPFHLAVLVWFYAVCLGLWQDKRKLRIFLILFLPLFFVFSLAILMGLLNFLYLEDWFFISVRCFWVALGLLLVGVGVRFFLVWAREMKAPPAQDHPVVETFFPWAIFARWYVAVACAALMAVTLLIWPPNAFMILILNDALLPGKGWEVFGQTVVYNLFKVAFLILVPIGIAVANGRIKRGQKPVLRRSTFLVLLSALNIAVGVGVVFVAVKQL